MTDEHEACDRLVAAVKELTEAAGAFAPSEEHGPYPAAAAAWSNQMTAYVISATESICKLVLAEAADELPDAMREFIWAVNRLAYAAFRLGDCYDIPADVADLLKHMTSTNIDNAKTVREKIMPEAFELEQSVLRDIRDL